MPGYRLRGAWYQLVSVRKCRRLPRPTISCLREVVPRRRARPGIHYRLGTIGVELGQGEPVIIRAVAADQWDPGARHRQGTGASDVMPWLDWLHPGLCV